MARKQKEGRRFGLASGRYRAKRKSCHVLCGKVKTVYKCINRGGKLTICRKPQSQANNRRTLNLFRTYNRKQFQVYRSVDGGLRSVEIHNVAASGYRVINLDCLQKHMSEVTRHTIMCEKAKHVVLTGGNPVIIESQVAHFGIAVILSVRCGGCKQKFVFETSPKLKVDGTRHYDINVRAVWGTIVSGNGLAHLNEQLASMDSPTMSQNTFNVIENEVNHRWKVVTEEEMSAANAEEKQIAIEKNNYHEGIPSITVICDGGWSKRSHKHSYNALGGAAVIIGAETKKILHIGIRNKYCYICNRCDTMGIKPTDHECFKNWNESSQSMESDIIVEGFLKANEHGVRYMNFIADGDSSIHAQIMQRVPIWGKHVCKLECANHVCKCLRTNLENLVNDNHSYKGKGKLCKRTRIRIVTAVRCAIRRRSADQTDKSKAQKDLEHDIRNTISHVYGDHTRCNKDFCQVKLNEISKRSKLDDDDEEEEDNDNDIFQEQSDLWTEGTSLEAQEDSRGLYGLKPSDLQSGMRQDLAIILNNVARKTNSLFGNFTTNLAESWMHIRSKFDGGKMYNHCNRGAWHTRCYAAGIRFNKGPTWSPKTWEQTTHSTSGYYFDKLYDQRGRCLTVNNKTKSKEEIKKKRWKTKMSSLKESNCRKARQHYGKESIQPETDLDQQQLEEAKQKYFKTQIEIPETTINIIEKTTKMQACCPKWTDERRKRITSSNFGNIIKRKPGIHVAPVVKQLLYSTFKGNRSTANGIKSERITIKEYINLKEKENKSTRVEHLGLVIHKHLKFLAASPDGKVFENDSVGLIEIKNVLLDKDLTLTQAASSVKNFCLQKCSNTLHLKQNHNYYYQCQGLMNICNLPWIDFVVRTVNPYDIHVERIFKDSTLWEMRMIPKLTAFYMKALLPELACPRFNKYPGIREPGIWYTEGTDNRSIPSQSISSKGKCRKRKKAQSSDDSDTDDQDTPIVPVCSTVKRGRRKCSRQKFVGRQILHEWIEENNNRKWYRGTVLAVLKKKDGDENAVYEVLYEDCDETFEVDHLLEDFRGSSLKLIDM